MAANAGEEYSHLAGMHGSEMAGDIAKFTLKNLERMRELIQEFEAVELSEMQDVQKLRVFLTAGKFEEFKRSIEMMERDHSSLRGLYKILNKEAVLKVCIFSRLWVFLFLTMRSSTAFTVLLAEH